MLFPTLLLFFTVAHIVWSGANETRVVSFCNSLELGMNQSSVIRRALKVKGSYRNQYSIGKETEMIGTKGIMDAVCAMKFKDKKFCLLYTSDAADE